MVSSIAVAHKVVTVHPFMLFMLISFLGEARCGRAFTCVTSAREQHLANEEQHPCQLRIFVAFSRSPLRFCG
jgi:hypothetical protein